MAVAIAVQDVAKLAPDMRTNYQQSIQAGQATFDAAGISASPLRVAHFFAQIMQECGALTLFTENMNYSAEGLMKTWPSRFPDLASTVGFAHNPQAIGDKVYGGRMGNGPNEGYKYRGRGLIQITGKTAYAALSNRPDLAVDLVADPDQAFSAAWSLKVACAFWTSKNINALADQDDIAAVTRAVNGGLNGLAGRTEGLRKAKAVWSG
jgi:putative chitinase